MKSVYDVIITGSGVAGSVAALALAKNSSLKIAIIEAQAVSSEWKQGEYDHRVSAISLASKRILQHLGVWSDIQAKRIASYTHMHVWDECGVGKIDFDCDDIQASELGYIIEDRVMRTSLLQKMFATTMDVYDGIKLVSLEKNPQHVELKTADGKVFSTKLLIAADGANSWVREQVKIEFKNRDYQQTAIVATVQTELPHQRTAQQRFLTTGPLAFLPLDDMHACSIVWSVTPELADELLALDDQAFIKKLEHAFEHRLGKITRVSQRYSFPLRMRHVKNYVEDRIALIGDAAHTLHPLAGQGVNLGMLDAATLVEVIITALEKNRDFASMNTLRKYERWRKSDNLVMLACVDMLKKVFVSDNAFVKNLRNTGLHFADQFSFLKNRLISHATGHRDDLPRLALK